MRLNWPGRRGLTPGMKPVNLPVTGPRYWTALSLASIFGANMGDFVSKILHLGHYQGLLPLAVIFSAIVVAERRVTVPTEAWYWLAIVTMRTAATNMGDLLTHDFKIPYPVAMAGLTGLLVAILLAEGHFAATERDGARARGMPAANGFYWAAMMTAGTLGTDIGDYVADILDLGVGLGSIALCIVLAVILGVRGGLGLLSGASYWVTVVAVRSAGTTVGDYCAGRHGLALGLPVSTACWGVALLVLLLAWKRNPVPAPA